MGSMLPAQAQAIGVEIDPALFAGALVLGIVIIEQAWPIGFWAAIRSTPPRAMKSWLN
jgi:hypothetical protein